MKLEIERKFLVRREIWDKLPKPEGESIRQGYLSRSPLMTVRVRLAGDKGYLTIKGATEGISRPEYEYPIPAVDAEELLNTFTTCFIDKIRYRIAFAGRSWEVDHFLGKNEGLILAEIELNDPDEKFDLPEWVGEEVTGDIRYYNSSLAEGRSPCT